MNKLYNFLRFSKSKLNYLIFHYIIRIIRIKFRNLNHKIKPEIHKENFFEFNSKKDNDKKNKLAIHTWGSPTINQELLTYHQKVFEKLNLPINYTRTKQIGHGRWMESILNSSESDVVIFFDLDCIPTNRNIVIKAAKYCIENESIFGIAQASNHIPPGDFIFCGPSFLAISVKAWREIGSPPLREFPGFDVAEYLSYLILKKNRKYFSLLPEFYFEQSGDYLHCFGEYGIGTYYEGGIFHLWQARNGRFLNYFITACNSVLNDKPIDKNQLIRSRKVDLSSITG